MNPEVFVSENAAGVVARTSNGRATVQLNRFANAQS